jgi:MoxR-like ATPase
VDELVTIADRTTGQTMPQPQIVADGAMVAAMQQLARGVPLAPHVTEAAARLVRTTQPQDSAAPDIVKRYVNWGSSPRGMQALILAGKISALLDGRYNVSIDDLREAALPALRHRLILNFEAQAEGITTDKIVAELTERVLEHA